jgi:uncharacterized RDD family membrane protein YckC
VAPIDDIAVLTSENVRLTYTLAGMGSRFAAFLADSLIVGLAMVAVTFVFFIAGLSLNEFGEVEIGQMSIIAAIYIVVMTFLLWGYYFFFEWANWGQTPGKQLLGIRVSMADGAPADTVACATRNVVRIIDTLLALLGITFFIMIFTPRYQRLGDLAAGTVVVKRRRLTFDDVIDASRSRDRAALSAARELEMADISVPIKISDTERKVLERYIERREGLPSQVRNKLAKDLAGRLRQRAPAGTADTLGDDRLIEAVLKEQKKAGR